MDVSCLLKIKIVRTNYMTSFAEVSTYFKILFGYETMMFRSIIIYFYTYHHQHVS